MRAMWIGTPTATQFGLGSEFFDRCPGQITPPGSVFIKNSEQLYGLWFFAINNFMEWCSQENGLQMGMPDENGFRTFQGRASFGALRTTSYWLTVILATLIETYIKDALTFVASIDPAIIQLPQDNLPSLSGAPPEGRPVSAILAREWARAWLRNRKEPAKWIEGFEQLGVNGFAQHLDKRLYELLGVRHLVVHSAGVVDEKYLQYHPTSPWRVGTEASIDDEMLHGFIQTTFEFFAPIEVHFVNRFVRGI